MSRESPVPDSSARQQQIFRRPASTVRAESARRELSSPAQSRNPHELPGLIKATLRVAESLEEAREQAALLRSDLDHVQGGFVDRWRYFQESRQQFIQSNKGISDATHIIGRRLLEDHHHLNEHEKKAHKLNDRLLTYNSLLQGKESELRTTLLKLIVKLPGVEAVQANQSETLEPASGSHVASSESVRSLSVDENPLLSTYHDLLGRVEWLYERITELTALRQEEVARRQRNIDQGEDVLDDADASQQFEDRLARARNDYDGAVLAAEEARSKCIDQGLNPDEPVELSKLYAASALSADEEQSSLAEQSVDPAGQSLAQDMPDILTWLEQKERSDNAAEPNDHAELLSPHPSQPHLPIRKRRRSKVVTWERLSKRYDKLKEARQAMLDLRNSIRISYGDLSDTAAEIASAHQALVREQGRVTSVIQQSQEILNNRVIEFDCQFRQVQEIEDQLLEQENRVTAMEAKYHIMLIELLDQRAAPDVHAESFVAISHKARPSRQSFAEDLVDQHSEFEGSLAKLASPEPRLMNATHCNYTGPEVRVASPM